MADRVERLFSNKRFLRAVLKKNFPPEVRCEDTLVMPAAVKPSPTRRVTPKSKRRAPVKTAPLQPGRSGRVLPRSNGS